MLKHEEKDGVPSIKLIKMDLVHGDFVLHQKFEHGLGHEWGASKINFHVAQVMGVKFLNHFVDKTSFTTTGQNLIN